MYAEVMDKSDKEEDDDIEEFVQEIAESPPEPSYSTPLSSSPCMM